jgi:PAS domain S-box-containing protein
MDQEQAFVFDQLINGLGSIVFESIKIPFGIFGAHHRVLWVNQALAAMHGKSPRDLIGKTCHRVIHDSTTPCTDCPIEEVFKTGQIYIYEKYQTLPNGKQVWGEVQNYPVRGNNGDIAGVITFGFDVTDKNNRIEVLNNYSKYLSAQLRGKRNPSQQITHTESDLTFRVTLSGREKEVLQLMTQGFTNLQIASLLSLSVNTVKTHVNHIFNKLGVNDRTQAAVLATRHHLV